MFFRYEDFSKDLYQTSLIGISAVILFIVSWIWVFKLVCYVWKKTGIDLNYDVALLIGISSTAWTMHSFPLLLLNSTPLILGVIKLWLYLQVNIFFMSIAFGKI